MREAHTVRFSNDFRRSSRVKGHVFGSREIQFVPLLSALKNSHPTAQATRGVTSGEPCSQRNERMRKVRLYKKDFHLTTFQELGLAEPILKALEGEGYVTPTPIQAKAIPPVMAGRDLLGIAQTGTGKTAAFALPILHRLAANRQAAPRRGCRALVLSPTRELATQIADSFRAYGRHLGFSVAVVFGGVAHRPQIQALSRGVDILIATPGRLIDHMEERHVALESTEIFVLDEADQMLDLGFVKPIRRIVSHLTTRRQNLFFSATMPGEIAGLAGELLNNPEKVAITPVATTAERVSQRVIHVEASRKRALLAELLADPAMTRTLVFTRTKRGADRVARHLETGGLHVAAIHGNKSQRQRENALEAFRTSRISVLVATDIAARGIDIDLVTHVVNYELPEVPEAYVHRIGRTARAGASGFAISLCDGEERDLLRAIERTTRQQIPSEDRRNDASLVADRAPAAAGGRSGDNGSNAHERRDNGRRQENGQGHRDGGECRARPVHHRGEGRPRHERDARGEDQRHGNNSGHNGHGRNSRPGDHNRGQRHERDHRSAQRAHAHHEEQPKREHGMRPRGEGRPDRSDLDGVAFLTRPGEHHDHHERRDHNQPRGEQGRRPDHRRDEGRGNRPLRAKRPFGSRPDARPARDRGAH